MTFINHAIDQLIDIALQEDVGPGDITTEALVDPELQGKAVIVAKERLVLAGLDVAQKVFNRLDPNTCCKSNYTDGAIVKNGTTVFEIEGKLRALLIGERTALNFLQRLSGIATCVHAYVKKLGSTSVSLVDTRKTTPGWRVLEKYAVRIGGAKNHRMGLYDGILIKDNHIAACGSIGRAVVLARARASHLMKIEVEVSNLTETMEALKAGADVIMLDNMEIGQIREAVRLIGGRAVVEVSGRVTTADLQELANAGVNLISVGALTHSAKSVDMSMRIHPP